MAVQALGSQADKGWLAGLIVPRDVVVDEVLLAALVRVALDVLEPVLEPVELLTPLTVVPLPVWTVTSAPELTILAFWERTT